jgi:hypothetical protein
MKMGFALAPLNGFVPKMDREKERERERERESFFFFFLLNDGVFIWYTIVF